MSSSKSCTVLVIVVIVGLMMGGLGFATGYITRTVATAGATDEMHETVEASPTEVPNTMAPASSTAEPALASEPNPGEAEAFDLFWEAWRLIEQEFYGEIPGDEEMTYGAIRGALETLDDPNTGFLEPDVAAINREDSSGSIEGIGALVRMDDGILIIVQPLKDQPAELVGLRRGDIVIRVDDTPIENMSIWEAITLIRGPAGSDVRLMIIRDGEAEPFEVVITRARIEIAVVEKEILEDGIAYVSLHEFSSDVSAKLEQAINELLLEDPVGLILDLRGNPGGFLREAFLTGGLFLEKGDLVLLERRSDGTESRYEVPADSSVPDLPMVVLVDAGSASASEIVAGALQDYGRAVLVGEQTFGKGSVQAAHQLSNGAELRVTIARWFTPNDRAIHGEGLTPDFVVELTEEDLDNDRDPQLERAIDYLLTGQ